MPPVGNDDPYAKDVILKERIATASIIIRNTNFILMIKPVLNYFGLKCH